MFTWKSIIFVYNLLIVFQKLKSRNKIKNNFSNGVQFKIGNYTEVNST